MVYPTMNLGLVGLFLGSSLGLFFFSVLLETLDAAKVRITLVELNLVIYSAANSTGIETGVGHGKRKG